MTLQSIQVSPANPTILSTALGKTHQFTASGTYSDGRTQNITSTVTWSSSNTTFTLTTAPVATINGSGLATTIEFGSAIITAAFNGVSGTATPTVSSPPPSVPM